MATWWAITLVGCGVDFLAGLFGAGGSAVGTPLPHAFGVPAFVAPASPLPGALPVALAASGAYGEHGYVDRRVVVWSVAIGFPATVGGALLTPHPGGPLLVRITEGVVAAIGVRLVLFPHEPQEHAKEPRTFPIRMVGPPPGWWTP
ncbi:sulfite exporter TauE/SafE family protein [Streptomyces sp. NPDC005774]|uniref:sulfite exporter TauE/SafE family protein n=1 Tax=Streptomyces sp. NPDC005774 TaxID=3364728 RepID=UPI0036A80BD0